MKKTTGTVLAFMAVLLCGILATESAFARGPRARVGIFVGAPFVGFGLGYGYHGGYYPPYYYPPYYYPPYYYNPSYYPTPVVVQPQTPVYVEQGDPAQAQPQPQQSQGYWYYCAGSRAYYPYVKECPAGWQRVAPQPG